MTDRPILFSAPMVQAIIEGRKVQARQALKPQPDILQWQGLQLMSPTDNRTRFRRVGEDYPDDASDDYFVRHSIKDRLWVQETWRAEAIYDGFPPREIPEDYCHICWVANDRVSDLDSMIRFGRKRPPTHMPRWASRLTLVVTDVRIQRLREITEEDKIAEGGTPRIPYETVWKEINGQKSWNISPWVVVLTFTVHGKNIDQWKEGA